MSSDTNSTDIFKFNPEPIKEFQNYPSPLNLGLSFNETRGSIHEISKFIDIKTDDSAIIHTDSKRNQEIQTKIFKDELNKFSEIFSNMGSEIISAIHRNPENLELELTKVIASYNTVYAKNIVKITNKINSANCIIS